MVRVSRTPFERGVDFAEGTARGPAGHSEDGDVGCAGSPVEAVGSQIGEVLL